MIIEAIGIIGVLLLAGAWIPQTIHTIKTHHRVSLKFNILYILGSLLLVAYSVIVRDIIFVILNGIALLMASINLFYTVKLR
jgi:lipid-A-disaccharide synthase-like uncharacterized protein